MLGEWKVPFTATPASAKEIWNSTFTDLLKQVHRLYSYCARTVLILRLYCTHTVHILYLHCTPTVLTLGRLR
jgi:hypothetical protein